jgi:hypothetical protein
VQEIYQPAYVEDLDLGFRAWGQSWPTVFVRDARVEHRHRATSSRYYSEEQLVAILEVNYLRFLTSAVSSPALFGKLWREAIERLQLLSDENALRFATRAPFLIHKTLAPMLAEAEFLALTAGQVAVFPGRGHGSAVVCAVGALETPAADLLDARVEVVLVKAPRDSLAFRAAVDQTTRKWSPRGILVSLNG